MPETTSRKKPIQLRVDAGQVMVEPEDEDRFIMASKEAVAACQSAEQSKRLVERFRTQFLQPLIVWCDAHSDKVRACYSPIPRGGLPKVFIVAKAPQFDFDLSDEIADLEMSLEETGWPTDILQISADTPEELATFFDPEDSIQIYGDGSRASGEG